MTSKQFRRLRVEAKLFGRGAALEWMKQESLTYDVLSARLSPFTPDANSRMKLYPLINR